MAKAPRWVLSALLLMAASFASAQTFYTNPSYGTARSAFREVYGNVEYEVFLETSGEDAPFYINQFELVTGDGWHPDLDLYVPDVSFWNGSEEYALGTEITGDHSWRFLGAYRNGAVAPTVDDGIYNATVNILGGADSSALDNLFSFDVQIHVLQSLGISVTASPEKNPIKQGESTKLFLTVQNNMADHDFVSTTWYISSFMKDSDRLKFDEFLFQDGGWFDQHVAPGESLTKEHSRWSAEIDQPLGEYTGNVGIVGGLYYGDWHFVPASPSPSITVEAVPEPAFYQLSALALLGGFALRRTLRRRAK